MRKLVSCLTLTGLLLASSINAQQREWPGKLAIKIIDYDADGIVEEVDVRIYSKEDVYLGNVIDQYSKYPNEGPYGEKSNKFTRIDEQGKLQTTNLYPNADGEIDTINESRILRNQLDEVLDRVNNSIRKYLEKHNYKLHKPKPNL